MTDSRGTVLARIRRALADVPADESPGDVPVPRDYRTAHTSADTDVVGLLATHLADYRAHVHHATEADLPELLAQLLSSRGAATVLVPDGLSGSWLARATARPVPESPEHTPHDLDGVDSVVTSCALAVAETGTLVLDHTAGQGRRATTLVPDHHVCVVPHSRVVASLPQAMPRLDPTRPHTWISGPSATSDIELDRVEGVHGPRTLDVVLLADR